MRYCTNCGHQLGVGRYCTNCGARTQGDATELAPVQTVPVEVAPVEAAPAQTGPVEVVPPPSGEPRRAPRPVLPWLVGGLLVAVVAAVGGVLLILGSSDDEPGQPQSGPGRSGTSDRDDRAERVGPEDLPAERPDELRPDDVRVPGTAPASVDSDGDQVTYEAGNLTDGDPRTCWRMAGDGDGSVITFTFDEPVIVTEVGLINGYAKTDPPHDWYAGNRRVTEAAWTFDDGTELIQELGEATALQTTEVDAVQTTTIELRLVDVTAPGKGPDARNFTAVSEVSITGH